MKNVLSLVIILFSVCNQALAQTLTASDVPADVRTAYKKKFPAVKDPRWKKKENGFEVNFVSNKKNMLVLYDEKGNIIETETEMKFAELPKKMTDFIMTNFRGQNPSKAIRITDAANKQRYMAEIDHLRYVFDDQGHFLEQLAERE